MGRPPTFVSTDSLSWTRDLVFPPILLFSLELDGELTSVVVQWEYRLQN